MTNKNVNGVDDYTNLNRFFPFDPDPFKKEEVEIKPVDVKIPEPKETPYGLDRFMDKRF